MRLLPSDPDVETIVGRIKAGDINLQPGFQRGEVWGRLKKQRLIDSILRDWHVPPIHVIENPKTQKQEVLDGQQRLVAIRDFVEEQFTVAASVEPFDAEIDSIKGLFYTQLPDKWRRRFNQFTIRVFRIVDYRASEPGELFYRLNQPTSLTGAEQRNAFFGPVREQIKDLVEEFSQQGIEKEVFGFSNSRMAYDDVLSRAALAIERDTLSTKITSGDLADLYRQEGALKLNSVSLIKDAVGVLASARRHGDRSYKLNKATLFSWLMFLVRSFVNGYSVRPDRLSYFLSFFQMSRNRAVHARGEDVTLQFGHLNVGFALSIYESRSVARVADVSSVILRDAVIWLIYERFVRETDDADEIPKSIQIEIVHSAFDSQNSVYLEDDGIARSLIDLGWGKLS
jgi:hypothetical protein